MFRKQSILAAAGAAAVLLTAAPSVAADSASTSIRVHGIVHTICDVQFDNQLGSPDENGVVDFGRMTEFCNDGDGYTVVVQTPANLQGATLYVDGVPTPVDQSGTTVLVDSPSPVWRQRMVKLDLGANAQLQSISFHAQPKGMVY